jgi:pyruvate dehydrogenase E2 component (dihydrolipoamide acetyltransferase)
MPKLSPTMETGTIVRWLKKEGEFVESGETLLEVATDKATVEHQALDEGYLRKIVVEEGQEAKVNQPIAIFAATKEEPLEGLPVEPLKIEVEPQSVIGQERVFQESTPKGVHFSPEKPLEGYVFERPLESVSRLKASPLAKKIAEEKGLDLTSIKGSGPSGRIVEKDLDKALPLGVFSSRKEPTIPPGSYTLKPLSQMRRVIGKRLQQSKTFTPHFYVEMEVDAMPLYTMKEELKALGLRITVNDLMIRATSLALRLHPEMNVGYSSEEESLIQFETIDLSVAVTLPEGLITPIIRHADYKSVGEISVEIRYLVEKAKEGKLEEREYKGGSFTVSNLGMYGVSRFSAILNPPQGAILAVSGIRDTVVFKGGQVVPSKVMALTVSCDHRVIDGAKASEFLAELKKIIEKPIALLT